MKITQIERIRVDIPYLERIRQHLQKGWNLGNRATDEDFQANKNEYLRQWHTSEPPTVRTSIYWVHTDEGLIGIGEGADIPESQLVSYFGKSPFEFIMADEVGALQIAFYDLMGQVVGLPSSQLLGPARSEVPIAYWSHSFPPEIMRQETEIAIEKGFKVHKFKRRAHTDVIDQVESICEVCPEDYDITIDANCTFGTPERVIEIGTQLQKYSQVKCLESPIDQEDVDGYRRLKDSLGYPLAIHFGTPHPTISLPLDVYDYYVLGGWASSIMRDANVISSADKPFWMQMGFTGISAIFMVHLASAIPNASLAHVSLFQLLEHSLLAEPLQISEGKAKVPEKPGFGIEIDMDAIDKYRVA